MERIISRRNAQWISTFLTMALFSACEEPDYPENIWNPDDQGGPTPVITSVEPDSGKVFAGVDTIRIKGGNFSLVENHVFFEGLEATIFSTSEAELVVEAPIMIGDSLTIKVSIQGAYLFGEYYPYKLQAASLDYYSFGESEIAYGMAMDNDENLYVSIDPGQKIVKVTPDGETSEYGTTSFPYSAKMKMGPEGYLYCIRVEKNKKLFRIPPGGGSSESFESFPEKVYDFDFDSDGNLYAGGEDSTLFRLTPGGDIKAVAVYPDQVEIRFVRVFDGYVYITGQYTGDDSTVVQEGIWRNLIINADTLDTTEFVFDWGEFADPDRPQITGITFSLDGDIYIGADKDEAIYVLQPPYDELPQPLYPNILEPPSNRLCWGNDDFLYVNRWDEKALVSRVIRIDTRKDGAPYYGRE